MSQYEQDGGQTGGHGQLQAAQSKMSLPSPCQNADHQASEKDFLRKPRHDGPEQKQPAQARDGRIPRQGRRPSRKPQVQQLAQGEKHQKPQGEPDQQGLVQGPPPVVEPPVRPRYAPEGKGHDPQGQAHLDQVVDQVPPETEPGVSETAHAPIRQAPAGFRESPNDQQSTRQGGRFRKQRAFRPACLNFFCCHLMPVHRLTSYLRDLTSPSSR